jgi:hypothetical protein
MANRGAASASAQWARRLPIPESKMTIHVHLVPILSIAAGILILVKPKILNYVVAIYLIVVGVIGLGLLK